MYRKQHKKSKQKGANPYFSVWAANPEEKRPGFQSLLPRLFLVITFKSYQKSIPTNSILTVVSTAKTFQNTVLILSQFYS